MSDSEEVDYMSEDFVSQCVGNDDVRPGLALSYSARRKSEMERKKRKKDEEHRNRMKPTKEIQRERLEEGLCTALSSSNKGFAMLQKMGYKPGTSLGKEGTGRLEPVAIEKKSHREGLGWEQMIIEKKERQKRKHQKNLQEYTDPEEFRARLKSQMQEKKLMQDLNKCKRICQTLDTQNGLKEPAESWFWPYVENSEDYDDSEGQQENETENNEDEEYYEEEYLPPEEELEVITTYLRSTYFYCIWCCTAYDDERDLRMNCPGNSRSDHDD